ncbi:hypothetical protein [Microbispora sp. KK1-11]|nr:hypothetical protein [Microbispora sp. KK1-11]
MRFGYGTNGFAELPRHGHAAPAVARRSIEFLRGAEQASRRHGEGRTA